LLDEFASRIIVDRAKKSAGEKKTAAAKKKPAAKVK
jgi:hypothetical protein